MELPYSFVSCIHRTPLDEICMEPSAVSAVICILLGLQALGLCLMLYRICYTTISLEPKQHMSVCFLQRQTRVEGAIFQSSSNHLVLFLSAFFKILGWAHCLGTVWTQLLGLFAPSPWVLGLAANDADQVKNWFGPLTVVLCLPNIRLLNCYQFFLNKWLYSSEALAGCHEKLSPPLTYSSCLLISQGLGSSLFIKSALG